ncbi:MAG: GntR family transcriptional regulator [Bacteroidales bacterium]|jgi:DNA-binding transcriptional regulator YhcF (GntR family)|nr:GntR family transcriptional regulator [Bacteroidales bacterium]
MKIEFTQEGTKFQQMVDAFTVAIGQGQYKVGDPLPSINALSKSNHVSRDTVFRAYLELKRRGLVDSTSTKGYYVNGAVNKVFMLLDTFSPFKDVLYNSFASNLPKGYGIDLLFHHYNLRVFESVINDSLGRYNMYAVMNFNNDKISDTLKKVDKGKLLILDWGKYKTGDYSYVCQDFDRALYDCLAAGLARIQKYRKMVMWLPESSSHPRSSIKWFKRFCKDHRIPFDIVERLNEKGVEKGTVYLVVPQKELVEMVKFCRNKHLKLGQDVGLIGYNDIPMYEIIENGITAISTDFAQMGKRAAEFIKSRQKVQEIIPTKLTVRGTL